MDCMGTNRAHPSAVNQDQQQTTPIRGRQPSGARQDAPQPTATNNEFDVIDVELCTDLDGMEFYAPQDFVLSGGTLVPLDQPGAVPTSSLPEDRMAGSSWDEVARAVREAEQGNRSRDVVIRPGGQIDIVDGGSAQTRSQLPTERMAGKPRITIEDVAEVRRLDPDNRERWQPTYTTILDGWRFRLRPHHAGITFTFLAFRSPNDSGLWRLWVVSPNSDHYRGHDDHMVSAVVNGSSIPVICAARGAAPARSLAEARAMAAKWALYTQRRLWGQRPIFSE